MPPKQIFTVVFTDHNFEDVRAYCKKEAVILAQARQIEKGNTFIVRFVKNSNNEVI